ncbi:hypothetical protein BB560_002230 [Smittium megazygosporum]|uniref:Uncharacterized protein n=1 Tax=Smittium megazygosporum TaxID=133381 RepID=A0A2T9ZFG3_9FUNG|nr:hypothetical protein BB560_002230 [Smittium megazygosporum]
MDMLKDAYIGKYIQRNYCRKINLSEELIVSEKNFPMFHKGQYEKFVTIEDIVSRVQSLRPSIQYLKLECMAIENHFLKIFSSGLRSFCS